MTDKRRQRDNAIARLWTTVRWAIRKLDATCVTAVDVAEIAAELRGALAELEGSEA